MIELKNKRLSIAMNDKQLKWTHELARLAGFLNLSSFIVYLIKEYYKENKPSLDKIETQKLNIEKET